MADRRSSFFVLNDAKSSNGDSPRGGLDTSNEERGPAAARGLHRGSGSFSQSFRRSIAIEMSATPSERSFGKRLSSGSTMTLNKLNLANLDIVYGRTDDVNRLKSTFESILPKSTPTNSSKPKLVLISGYSGIGKSVLAEQLRNPVTETNGFFVRGKFDQQLSIKPYKAFVAAFSELTEAILAHPESGDLIQSIQKAVGSEGRVLTKIIPSLKRILGHTRLETEDLGPVESKNRLRFLFQNFTRAICCTNPLVIVLDDLQWADMASLELYEILAMDVHNSSLLLVGTYRNNEVSPTHPFTVLLDSIEEAGIQVQRISLGNLKVEDVNSLIAMTLRTTEDHSQPLATIVARKSGGNPFFVKAFLKTLCEKQLLLYKLNKWEWDTEGIQSLVVTENVADLVVGNIKGLPLQTQKVLLVAACLGPSFSLDALLLAFDGLENTNILSAFSPVEEEALQEIDDELDICISEGLVDYGRQESTINVTYSFLHDQIQQAALSLITKEKLPALQMHIGQSLLSKVDKYLFVAMDLCNRGFAASSNTIGNDSQKCIRLAEFNLVAAQKVNFKSIGFLFCSVFHSSLMHFGLAYSATTFSSCFCFTFRQ